MRGFTHHLSLIARANHIHDIFSAENCTVILAPKKRDDVSFNLGKMFPFT
jgi:hypothetical protein